MRRFIVGLLCALGLAVSADANVIPLGPHRALLNHSGYLAVADSVMSGTFSSPLAPIAWPNGAPPKGNLLMACAWYNGTSATLTPPTGWTTLINASSGATDFAPFGLFYEITNGGETTETWTNTPASSHLDVAMISISGENQTSPFGTSSFVQSYTTATPATAGPITPSVTKALPVAFFCGFHNGSPSPVIAASQGFAIASSGTDANAGGVATVEYGPLSANTSTALTASSVVTNAYNVLNAAIVYVSPHL